MLPYSASARQPFGTASLLNRAPELRPPHFSCPILTSTGAPLCHSAIVQTSLKAKKMKSDRSYVCLLSCIGLNDRSAVIKQHRPYAHMFRAYPVQVLCLKFTNFHIQRRQNRLIIIAKHDSNRIRIADILFQSFGKCICCFCQFARAVNKPGIKFSSYIDDDGDELLVTKKSDFLCTICCPLQSPIVHRVRIHCKKKRA